jgi:hypothetical protein
LRPISLQRTGKAPILMQLLRSVKKGSCAILSGRPRATGPAEQPANIPIRSFRLNIGLYLTDFKGLGASCAVSATPERALTPVNGGK